MKIKINKDTYNVKVAIKAADLMKGLSGTDSLDDDKGMLFLFNRPHEIFMVMDKMTYPLDMIFIDKDGLISNIETAEVGDKEYHSNGPIKAVLEINKGKSEGYKLGDKVTIINDAITSEEKAKAKETGERFIGGLKGGGSVLTKDPTKALKIGDVRYDIKVKDVPFVEGALHVLDNDGNVIYNMKGANRVFSIPDTKEIFNKTLQSQEGGKKEQIELGKLMVKILNTHDEQEGQFVSK